MLAKTDETQMTEADLVDAIVDAADAGLPLPARVPDDLRRAVRDWVNANASTLKAVAKEADVAESTFTAWLGGKFKGNNERIDEKVRIWLSAKLNFARRELALPQNIGFVLTRSSRKIMSALEHAQCNPDISVITGGAGVGKTSSCHEYAKTYPNVWILTGRRSLSSAYSITEYLRAKLGVPETAPFRVSEAISLRLQGTRGLIIVDEAQHLKTEAFDELRSLHDLAGIGIAFVGNHGVWERIDGGGRQAQLAQLFSRVGMRVNISKSSGGDADDILDAEGIDDPKMRRFLRAIAVRPGALRQMHKVLAGARKLAVGAEEELNERHVEAFWNRLSGGEAVAL